MMQHPKVRLLKVDRSNVHAGALLTVAFEQDASPEYIERTIRTIAENLDPAEATWWVEVKDS